MKLSLSRLSGPSHLSIRQNNGSGKTNCGLFLPKELLLKSFTYVSTPQKRGILERLDAGEVVIGDGGFVFALEKRGYVQAGPWTPEANVEHPSAGKEFR